MHIKKESNLTYCLPISYTYMIQRTNFKILQRAKIVKKGKKLIIFIVYICMLAFKQSSARSVYRPDDILVPELTVSWDHNSSVRYTIKDSHIEPYPLFKIFDKKHFCKLLLP